jgi:hypothetical protein
MNAKKLKTLFNQVAGSFGFTSAFGGWVKQSPDCIVVLELQRSNFGDYFELNIKFFFIGLFGKIPSVDKTLIVKENGNVFLRPPKKYSSLFDISGEPNEAELTKGLSEFFRVFLMPIIAEGGSRSGMLKLADAGKVFLLPAVKAELKK